MSVRLRLRRDGAKKRPFYHLVAADIRRARNGRFIEELGYYNPIVAADAEPIIMLKEDRIRYWLSVGAQPSDTAASLLQKVGILERKAVPAKAAPAAEATAETTNAESTEATGGEENTETTGAEASDAPAETPAETPAADEA
jgi:small subunit ribosomal protein S16